jgi:Outer membrane protein beta-barrel domain
MIGCMLRSRPNFPAAMHLRVTRTLLLLTLLGSAFIAAPARGQERIVTQNLPNFDLHRFHFGFLLSYNTSDFNMRLKPGALATDSLLAVDHIRAPGFNLGIVASYNMSNNFSLRFLPTLSFQDRILQYDFLRQDSTVADFDKPVESTYLEFPLHVKFRSNRINNFAVYMLAGGKMSIDMASKKDVNNAIDDEVVVKLEKYDYSVDVGAGVDMFLPYFKFGIELKHSIGLPNLLVDDGTKFSAPIESLRSKVWVLTFTFEG